MAAPLHDAGAPPIDDAHLADRPDLTALQRRTIAVLVATQILGGVGVAAGLTVGALLAADLGGPGLSGLATSAAVIGGALLVVPATRLMRDGGRRPGLVFAYGAAVVGALMVIAGTVVTQLWLVLTGMALFGGGTTANLQSRYTAVDLAEPLRRGRQLSLVVWATTVGAVAGPAMAPLADGVTSGWGWPRYAGPYAFSALAFAAAATVLSLFLRPDPLAAARHRDAATTGGTAPVADVPGRRRGGVREGIAAVRTSGPARLGMAAVATGHVVMVGVMSMTPVHIGAGSTDHTAVLRIVGLVLSVHIAGMYAASPIMGWLTDRVGRCPVIVLGGTLLLGACAVAGTAGHHAGRLAFGLALLGLGWSATMVSGSTLLSESVDVAARPAAQGFSDLVMGLAGAGSAAVSGLVVEVGGYPTLTALAATTALPVLVLAARAVVAVHGDGPLVAPAE